MYNKKHTTTNFLTTLLSSLSLFAKTSTPAANKAIAKAKKARPITNYNISVIASSKASPARTQKSRRQ